MGSRVDGVVKRTVEACPDGRRRDGVWKEGAEVPGGIGFLGRQWCVWMRGLLGVAGVFAVTLILPGCVPPAPEGSTPSPSVSELPGTDSPGVSPSPTAAEPSPTEGPEASPLDPEDFRTPVPVDPIDDVWDVELTPSPQDGGGFRIVGSFPQDGSAAVPAFLYIQFFFSEPWAGELELLHASVRGDSGRVLDLTQPELSPDSMTVGYEAQLWGEDAEYTLRLGIDQNDILDAVWPLVYEASFSTAGVPCDLTFDLYPGLRFVKVGASKPPPEIPVETPVPEPTPTVAPDGTPYPTPWPTVPPDDSTIVDLLNIMLNATDTTYPTAFFLKGVTRMFQFPIDTFGTALASVYEVEPELYSIYADTGITGELEACSVDSVGRLSCSDDLTIFPLRLYELYQVYLYLQQAEAKGMLQKSEKIESLTDFSLTGVMYGTDLFNLLQQAGYSDLAAVVYLDVDTDDDGFPDAASVELVSDPQPIQLKQCQY